MPKQPELAIVVVIVVESSSVGESDSISEGVRRTICGA